MKNTLLLCAVLGLSFFGLQAQESKERATAYMVAPDFDKFSGLKM